jgi:hypothetical protein
MNGHSRIPIHEPRERALPSRASYGCEYMRYDSDAGLTDEENIEGLMEITALSLADWLADEPDLYTVDDLKMRFERVVKQERTS